MSVGAPAAFEPERIEIEDHHAAAQVIVGGVKFARRFVKPDLFDAADDHRGRRRILLSKSFRCGRASRLRRGIELPAAAGGSEESGDGAGAAAAGSVRRGQRRIGAGAGRPLGRARHFGDHFACFRIVLADRVLTDVDEALAVDRHAVPLRGIEGTDHAAGLVDVNHGGRADAAIGERRSQFGFELDIGEIVGTVEDPDIVVLVHGEPGDTAHFPFVGKGPGPAGIEPEFRRGGFLRGEWHGQYQ